MVRKLRRKVHGSQDPGVPSFITVPVRKTQPGLPKVNYSVPDTSYFKVDKRTNRAVAIVTITPDGVELGWDNCGTCASSLNTCDCSAGISLPNSISYIFVSRGGSKPPPPMPEAVVFLPPTPRRKLVPVAEKPRPKRQLLRLKKEQIEEEEATQQVAREFRKLKRRR